MAPGGWRLIEWSEDARAFVLRLPQERGSADGYVRCELSPAPERLADLQRRNLAWNEREQRSGDPQRKLLSDDFEGAAGPPERQRLATVWELLDERARHPDEKRFEVTLRIVRDETLYTFTLISDEAHFDAYRADFDDLVAGAKITPPETGLTAAAGGYWMQPQFQFGLRPPTGWKPAFGPSNRALWCARGAPHGLVADQLTVAASPSAPLNLTALRATAPETLLKAHPSAELIACRIVRQGNFDALETVFRIKQEGVVVTLLERRFAGLRRNYEIRAACEAASFEQQEVEIRKALDSFGELAEEPARPAL